MAKNLTARQTLVTLRVRGAGTSLYTFQTRESMMDFLYSTAVENWNLSGAIPGTRKGALDSFFGERTGNSYECETVTFVSNEGAARSARASGSFVRSQRGAQTPQQQVRAAGRSR